MTPLSPSDASPKSHTKSAIWKWSRLAACGMIWLRGPSRTSEVTSSPRCAGKQWRKIASGACAGQQFLVDLVGCEYAPARFGLVLLAHARPYVGVDDVGPIDRDLWDRIRRPRERREIGSRNVAWKSGGNS